ncbi:MAG TPA: rod shape-determining protein MreD [candidate division Zixibacteria bacterium]|nr:rod shape-determining protein MreD [candidate division Zixibacteria bacterium]MDD4916775.1 rod shape-determining protein MreD [candidate division Zixibacteria bacterium]MDM7973912.1 rod shape-determining protein MreD [candidate division Zixibacteria bacterium]HOD66114.1 rod shape-determining protein MreD [candidate division Zixibacteria bacterium]HOZ06842.1 rod shape-determining protein MreD [candidate division Zixibacteria bacterium]
MTVIPYLLYLLLVAFHEVILRDLTAIYGVTINLPVLLVLGVALYKPEAAALWFGFAAGLAASAARPELSGWYALLTAGLAAAAWHVRERLNLEALLSKLLLVFLGVLAYNLVAAAVGGLEGYWFHVYRLQIPGAVYTALVAWVFFLFKERRVTAQKLKAMF